MTNRFQRASAIRTLESHEQRVNALEFGTPLPTFRAWITDNYDSFITDRRGYVDITAVGSPDTVFWDYWENGDRRFFEEFVQPSGPDQGRVGAVELLVPGLYAIYASIDWDDFFDGHTFLGSNYDGGGVDSIYVPWVSQWLGNLAISHFRVVWPNADSGEFNVEIIVSHTDTGATRYIPGGNGGFMGMTPTLVITYLGGITSDEFFGTDV